MTDITNIQKYISNTSNEEKLETPNISEYNLNAITEYNLQIPSIVKRQIFFVLFTSSLVALFSCFRIKLSA